MSLREYVYYEEPGITLYCGDCRDVLPLLGSVDLVLTDPPYGVGMIYAGAYDDSASGYAAWLWPVMEEAERHVTRAGSVAMFQSALYATRWSAWIPRDWRLIALPKTFTQLGRVFLPWACDYVLWWTLDQHSKGPQDWQPPTARNWFVSRQAADTGQPFIKDHPCPRPYDTMAFLVSCLAAPNALILDPFTGSGSLLQAAKTLGRRAIGIEIEPRYCEIAVKRLRQEVLALDT